MLESVTECYRVLQSITENSRVLQNIKEYYRVFLAHLLGPISGLVLLKSLAVGDNLQVVNSWEEWGRYKEDEAKETVSLKEVGPLEPGMEAGEHQGDDEDHQHGGQEVLLGWSGGQAGGLEVFTTAL